MTLPDPRALGAVLAVILVAVILVVAALAHRRRGTFAHPYVARLLFISLVLLALLRLYSATSFLWADNLATTDIGVTIQSLLRYGVISTMVVIILLCAAVVLYLARRR